MARSNNNDRDEFHFKEGSCNIILKQGDLLNENDVDVLVIPTPDLNEANPENFKLYKSVYSSADGDYKSKLKRVRSDLKLLNPQVISKNGHGCIFAMPPFLGNPEKARDLLKKTYISCLNLAVKNNFGKIAFPTIGCGVIGFGTMDAARCVYSALENFGQSNDGKKMDEIRIIIYDSGVWKDFTTIFMDLSDSRDAKIKFIEISSKESNLSEMPSKKDEKRIPQRQPQQEESNYSDDFDDTAGNERDRARKPTSNLNPDSPEYQPRHNNQHRGRRRYLINNQRTELHIFQGDILTTKVDAIVNAANENMLGGGGVDGVIHRAAGNELLRACRAHKEIYRGVRLPTGRSRILLSYDMSKTTHYIINTAGPRYDDAPPKKCKEDLISCYKTSLALANLYDLETIGFTAISCGIFGYPVDEGAEVALTTVDSNANSIKEIFFVLKDDDIYDAWIEQARQLGFISMDDGGAEATNTSKKPTSDTRKITDKPSSKDDSNVRSAQMKVIDGSTSDSTGKPAESDHENSSENLLPNPNEKSNSQEPMGNEADNNVRHEDNEREKTKSEIKKSDNQEKEKTSDNSSKQKQPQTKDQKSEPRSTQQDTKNSIASGGGGRGKKK